MALLGALGGLGRAVSAATKAYSSASSGSGYKATPASSGTTRVSRDYSREYQEARARGDWQGMQAANEAANRLRQQSGQAPQYATQDISNVRMAYSPQQQPYQSPQYGEAYVEQSPYETAAEEYAKQKAQQDELTRQLYQQKISQGTRQLEQRRGTVGAQFDEAARQAYISRMQQQRAMPQQLAAAGITGGASESALLQQQAQGESQRAQIEAARQQAYQNINDAVANLQASGNIEEAQALLKNADAVAENRIRAVYQDISRRDELRQQAIQQQRAAEQENYQRALQESSITGMYGGEPTMESQRLAYARRQDLYAQALQTANLTGDYSPLRQFGWTDAQIQNANRQVAQSFEVGGGERSSKSKKRSGRKGSSGQQPAAPVDYGKPKQEVTPVIQSMMTQTEWARHKASGTDTSGASQYKTYQDYVNAYKKYATSRG